MYCWNLHFGSRSERGDLQNERHGEHIELTPIFIARMAHDGPVVWAPAFRLLSGHPTHLQRRL